MIFNEIPTSYNWLICSKLWGRPSGYFWRSKETRVLLYSMNIWELYSINQAWWDMCISSSSYRPASFSLCLSHSRVLMFHTLQRRQRDPRLCALVSYIRYVYLSLLLHPRSLPLRPLRHSSPPSFSGVSPSRLLHAWSHQDITTCSPGYLSEPSNRSNSDRIAMYCVTMFL